MEEGAYDGLLEEADTGGRAWDHRKHEDRRKTQLNLEPREH